MAAGANAIKDGNSAPVVITAMRTAPVVVVAADARKIVMAVASATVAEAVKAATLV